MSKDQWTLHNLLLGLNDTHINVLISQLDSNILPPDAFLDSLSLEHASTVKRACFITFALTQHIILKEWQLATTLDILAGHDTILNASTGAGKTMLIVLPMLLRPGFISITVSPLKWLMSSQAAELCRYGLRAAIVNEDTSHDTELFKGIIDGHYNHVHISSKQLQRHHGHFTRFYHLLDQPAFRRWIRVINIDEGHEAGRAALGLDDFHPSYTRLCMFRLKLPHDIPFVVLSATLPCHIISPLSKLFLLKDLKETRLCLNHSNVYYAVKPLITGTKEFRNLSLLIPASANLLSSLRKTIIFFDDKHKLDGACRFLRKEYAKLVGPTSGEHQILPVVRTLVMGYHSDMSSTYLQSTYEDCVWML